MEKNKSSKLSFTCQNPDCKQSIIFLGNTLHSCEGCNTDQVAQLDKENLGINFADNILARFCLICKEQMFFLRWQYLQNIYTEKYTCKKCKCEWYVGQEKKEKSEEKKPEKEKKKGFWSND